MLDPKCPFPNRERAAEARLSLDILALSLAKHCQVVKACCHLWMVRPPGSLSDGQRTQAIGIGLGVAFLGSIEIR